QISPENLTCGILFLGYLFIHPIVDNNGLILEGITSNLAQTCTGLKDELITFWWSRSRSL
ncbi:hypothetical protein P3454_26325, partial [Vibrio parahaemolyticus]|nr:hypothetical protein [Vibrio parahaemolyticus]